MSCYEYVDNGPCKNKFAYVRPSQISHSIFIRVMRYLEFEWHHFSHNISIFKDYLSLASLEHTSSFAYRVIFTTNMLTAYIILLRIWLL